MAGLKHIGAPIAIATLVSLIFAVPSLSWDRPEQHFEAFSGQMEVTKAEWRAGRSAVPFDFAYDNINMNLLTNEGFSNALFHACNLEIGSGHVTAPVCSTWVFMSRGSTLRSKSRPLGRRDSLAVREGNLLTVRALILLIICTAKGIWWVLEQPSTSIMEYHPLFQELLKMITVHKKGIAMSSFGAPTKKRTTLYSSHAEIDDIDQFQVPERLESKQMVIRYTNSKGESRCCGGRDLKGSQAYPKQFADALSKCRTLHARRNLKRAMKFVRTAMKTENKYNMRARKNRAWVAGGNLQPIFDYLTSK